MMTLLLGLAKFAFAEEKIMLKSGFNFFNLTFYPCILVSDMHPIFVQF